MPAHPPPLSPPTNHVFVDFENVPHLDLASAITHTVAWTLFLGARQKKLDSNLVEQLLKHAASVQLIRLESSGKNALDFTLAYYVGRAVITDPTGYFHIISGDTGFDPLVEHLRSRSIRAHRHPDLTTLTFCHPAKAASKSSGGKGDQPIQPPTKAIPPPLLKPIEDLKARVLEHLRTHPKNRPKKRKSLTSHLKTVAGKTPLNEIEALIEELVHDGQIAFEKDKVTYHVQ